MIEKEAVILAAGYGKRMGEAGEKTPKPLMQLAQKPMILWAYERLKQAGVKNFHINIHHLATQFHDLFKDYADVRLYEEVELLDTGGGVKKMLPHLPERFFVFNADCLWLDAQHASSHQAMPSLLWQGFDDVCEHGAKGLSLLIPLKKAKGYHGKGDFIMDGAGKLKRGDGQFVFAGAQILHQEALWDIQKDKFSLNMVYDRLIQQQELYGYIHNGQWFHTGDPDSLNEASQIFSDIF